MAIYSIPQQLTGKLTIISKAFSAFLLPNIKNKTYEFYYTLDIFVKYIRFLYLFFSFISSYLKFLVGDKYSSLILDLTKIFSLISVYSCTSHILITKFEADQTSKNNFRIEIFFCLFMIALFYFALNLKSLILISLLILTKEFSLVLLRLKFLNLKTNKIKNLLKYLLFFPILLLLSFINTQLFYILLSVQIILTIKDAKQYN